MLSGPSVAARLHADADGDSTVEPDLDLFDDLLDDNGRDDERHRRAFLRVFVVVRIFVVASIGFLVVTAPEQSAHQSRAAVLVLSIAFVWAILLVGRETRQPRHRWTPRAFTLVDSILALALVFLTGGQESPAVSVLIIVVITAATRHSAFGGVGVALALGAVYTAFGLIDRPDPTGVAEAGRLLWWPLYFVLTAVITTALTTVAERERSSRLVARFAARAEHAAAAEERDLRQRLLRSYQSQQNGLRVLLHEFQTPVVSLRALGQALADEQQSPLSVDERRSTVRIANEQIEHLQEMLGALGDVAISWRPAFQRGRRREVDLIALLEAAGHAAGVAPPRLQWTVIGVNRPLRLDAQAMRRVLTNLIENAGRHGTDEPVDVDVEFAPARLVLRIQDRGPGVPERMLDQLSGMYTSVGDVHGSAGLGLWIVQQIVDASGGTLAFALRDGGGLVATVSLPLATTGESVSVQAP